MGFFSKLRKGLEKTKHSLIQNIETVVEAVEDTAEDRGITLTPQRPTVN